MPSITDYYNIAAKQVPFLNIDVKTDNYLFVDAYSIRMGLGPSRFAASANMHTKSFFDEIVRCVLSNRASDHVLGRDLLQQFAEPRETRLGMSARGFDGHGGAEGTGQHIWDALRSDARALVRIGILHQLEDIPVFVEGIGNDITSDLTTRIIYLPLVRFTASMTRQFPQLQGGTGVQRFIRQVWNATTLNWQSRTVSLPTVDGNALLLVPDTWARRNLTLNATRFYDTTLLSFIQEQRSTPGANGKPIKTPKDRLRLDPRIARSYDTIIREVQSAYTRRDEDLLQRFKRFARDRYKE